MTITLDLRPFVELSQAQFYELCRHHPDLRIERQATGEITIMPPVGGDGSSRNANLIHALVSWNKVSRSGVCFDSSAGFTLPSGAQRSPDASWVALDHWQALTSEQRRRFPPLCPDFVVELCSRSDSRPELQAKMREYLANGARLAWLLDPERQRAESYRARLAMSALRSPERLSGEDVLPGFELSLEGIL
jgi:Uma2 family endonuclease